MIFNNVLANSWCTQHVWGEKKGKGKKEGKGKKKKKKRRNLKYLPFTRDDLAQYLRGLGALLS